MLVVGTIFRSPHTKVASQRIRGSLYSGKLWQALNLVKQSSECIGGFLIWQLRVPPHKATVHEIIMAEFKFGDFPQNCQFTKVSHYMVFLKQEQSGGMGFVHCTEMVCFSQGRLLDVSLYVVASMVTDRHTDTHILKLITVTLLTHDYTDLSVGNWG